MKKTLITVVASLAATGCGGNSENGGTASSEAESGLSASAYIPDYMGDHFASIFVQALFFALLIVFTVRLARWLGRAYYMTKKLLVDKEVVVGSHVPEGAASVGWVDQGKATFKQAFRDWCWPHPPVAASPFQAWIDDIQERIDSFCQKNAAGLHADAPKDLEFVHAEYLLMFGWEGLIRMGISKRVRQRIERVFNEMDEAVELVNVASGTANSSDEERLGREAVNRMAECRDKLGKVARSGRMPWDIANGRLD